MIDDSNGNEKADDGWLKCSATLFIIGGELNICIALTDPWCSDPCNNMWHSASSCTLVRFSNSPDGSDIYVSRGTWLAVQCTVYIQYVMKSLTQCFVFSVLSVTSKLMYRCIDWSVMQPPTLCIIMQYFTKSGQYCDAQYMHLQLYVELKVLLLSLYCTVCLQCNRVPAVLLSWSIRCQKQ